MFKRLDRYIIKKFLSTFFFVVLIFTMISVVIDFSEKVDDFIEKPITIQEIALKYYPGFIVWIDGLLWPLFTLIALIFFTSRMASNSEIISILNAGVSFRRLMVPYLSAAGFLALILLVGNHYFIPFANQARLDINYQYFQTDGDKGRTRNVHLFLSPQEKVYVGNYRKRDSTAFNFRIERFEDNELRAYLKAQRARFQGSTDEWRLFNYEIRKFHGLEEDLILGQRNTLDTAISLRPEDFVDFQEQQAMMTTAELRDYIRQQKAKGVSNTPKYEIELYRRWTEPVTILILTLIGMAIASRKVRGGVGLHLAIGMGLGALYIFLSRFSIVFATGQVVPIVLGMWMPNIVFGAVAVWLVGKAQK